MKSMTQWSIGHADASPFVAPEIRGLCLKGRVDGRLVRTSRIVEKIGPRTLRTENSIYELVGDPDPEYVAWCAAKGIALDPADPVHLRGGR